MKELYKKNSNANSAGEIAYTCECRASYCGHGCNTDEQTYLKADRDIFYISRVYSSSGVEPW